MAKRRNAKLVDAGVCTGGGAAVGVVTALAVGEIGLAAGGTAIAVGAAPIVVVGALLGLAGYGVYSLFCDD